MTDYDDYFTHDDKPFAENLNDALLLSNVFDFTVPIRLPEMFNNSAWVNTLSPRKAGVAIITLDELMNDITITNDSEGNSVLEATGNTSFGFLFYPNFNSFGSIYSVDWEGEGNITVDLYTADNQLIQASISKGVISNSNPHLRELEQVLFVVHMPGGSVLNSFEIVMKNKQVERYGAEVGISDVTGLQEQLNGKVNISSIVNNLSSNEVSRPLSANMGKVLDSRISGKVDKVNGKGLSTNDFNNNYKTKLDNINSTVTPLYLAGSLKGRIIEIKNGSVTWYLLQLINYTAPRNTTLTESNIPSKLFTNPFGSDIQLPSIWIHSPPSSVYSFNIELLNGNRYWGFVTNQSSDVVLGSVFYVGLKL
ncbi:hypothetical protein [Methanobrevibacter olleyae]|uniref:Uncharacterized protein n=1 Tax=Methanobrevibacter olleyae TaxID=294671 RepID=A0A126R2Q8_METOL|nr:hypothetical protein [Methanobrevibacter olleyae]AMK16334.1 hypothetical protein YLM1_1779 [Methanobrevibacter olleyae]